MKSPDLFQKRCSLTMHTSSTMRSCVVDNIERDREGPNQTLDKGDCLDYLSMMASRIRMTEIKAC